MTANVNGLDIHGQQDEADDSSSSVRAERVLYVEDDAVQSALILPLLEDEGFTVDAVCDGAKALDRLNTNRYDIVLTDHYMPNMSGMDLLNAITQFKLSVPVVIMTSANDLSIAFTALNSGATDFITKDSDGNYVEYLGVVLQQAVKKFRLKVKTAKLEAELEREREISRLTLDSMSQGVITLDRYKNIRYCNAWFKKLFGASNLIKSNGYTLFELASILAVHGAANSNGTSAKTVEKQLHELVDGDRDTFEYQMQDRYYDIKLTDIRDAGYIVSFIDVTQSKKAYKTLQDVIYRAPVAIAAINPYGDIRLMNARWEEMFEINGENDSSRVIQQFFNDLSMPGFSQWLKQQSTGQNFNDHPSTLDSTVVTSSGRELPVEIAISEVNINNERILLVTMVDIGHRKRSEDAIRSAAQLKHSIIENSPFNIVATDMNGVITAVSPALERMLGYVKMDLVGKQNIVQLHDREELASRLEIPQIDNEKNKQQLFNSLVCKAKSGTIESQDWNYIKRNGDPISVNLTITTLQQGSGENSGFLFVSYDVTEQRKASEYIRYLAHHDPLTGLPNRALMQDRLSQSILLAKRHAVKTGILMIDLDHFKRINDTLGHLAGDALLKEVASRLVNCVRSSDTVCRMGGDEFIVIVDDVDQQDDVELVAKKIIDQLEQPIKIGANEINVTPSIGISIAPDDGNNLEDLLRHADIAMYRVKQSGRNSYAIFSSDLHEDKAEHVALEQDLHEAFDKKQFSLHYQPQIDLTTGRVLGFEALLRWTHAKKGNIPPDIFIPLAEETGLIVPLGEWVMVKACEDIQALRELHNTDYSVAVNVSPRQFEDSNFIRATDLAMRKTGLPPNRLELEITEGLLVQESDHVTSKLTVLKRMGVALAIDDFGTGYSCLSYVAQYPITTIKIDRAFMALERKENAAIVGAITAIGQGLGMDVIAEGIEDQAQENFVRLKGCRLAQGYFYAKPVPFSSLSAIVEKINSSHLEKAM